MCHVQHKNTKQRMFVEDKLIFSYLFFNCSDCFVLITRIINANTKHILQYYYYRNKSCRYVCAFLKTHARSFLNNNRSYDKSNYKLHVSWEKKKKKPINLDY